MVTLKQKTRPGTDYFGKPRVYFCCHPEDFDLYFHDISNELLKLQNCAMWYDDDGQHRDEEYLSNLKQMQLFVMPVTRKLLCSENAALEREFRFAMEQHIPVLPLMQEQGLEQLFNQKCGDLQFLDRHNGDETAIAYEKKLEQYLQSLLVGDRLAGRIRTAFDACLFLSYRKKDRKYAQELMHLIHENPFSRDVAIWYDEFLTPGEDFHHSIAEALRTSDLFVLAVTPNLVNETNYIMTTEYPMAQREGKKILPVELLPTDRQRLADAYQQLPEPIDAHNGPKLSGALEQWIRKRERQHPPLEHDYLIGMAYLNGVDVEVDYRKAVTRITAAAEAGQPEAVDELYNMYLNGKGVARDYEKATHWLEQKVTLLRKQVMAEGTEEHYRALISALVQLSEHYEKVMGNRVQAHNGYLERNMLCQKAYEKFPTPAFRRLLGASYTAAAQVYLETEEFDRAEVCIGKAFELLHSFREEQRKAMAEHIETATLGQLYQYQVSCNDLATMYQALADVAYSKKDHEKAEQYLLRYLQLRQEFQQYFKEDPIALINVAAAHLVLGRFYAQMGRVAEALTYCEKGYPVALDLANRTGYLYAGEVSIRLYMLQAQLSLQQNRPEAAKHCYLTNLVYLEASSLTPQMQRLKAENQYEAARVCYLLEEYHTAADCLEKYLKTAGELYDKEQYHGIYEKELEHLTDCYIRAGDRKRAIGLHQKRLEAKQRAYEAAPGDEIKVLELIRSLLIMGDVCLRCGCYDSAEVYYGSAWKMSKLLRVFAEKTSEDCYACTVEACTKLAKLFQNLKQEDRKKVQKYFSAGIKAGKKALRHHRTEETYRGLVKVCADLGDWHKKGNEQKAALKCYTEAVYLAEELVILSGKNDDRYLLASLYLVAGVIPGKNGQTMLQRSQKLFQQLLQADPASPEYRRGSKLVSRALNPETNSGDSPSASEQ